MIEANPLIPSSISLELIAPIASAIGIGALFESIPLSLKIKCFPPSRTAISACERNSSNLFFKLPLISKVQSKTLIFFLKKSINFSNCEFDKIGLSRTYILSLVKFSKSRILPVLPKRVFKLMTSFSLNESIGGFVT